MSIHSISTKNIKKIRTMWESKSHDDFIRQIDSECSFIDYFAIIGLDPKICLNNYLYTTSPQDLNELYNKEIIPEILTKYPPYKKTYINIDESLITLCFPNGIKLEKHNCRPEPKIMNFLLDNHYFSIQHPYKFVTCLMFYEILNNYYDLKMKIEEELKNGEEEEILKSLNSGSINNNVDIIDKKVIEKYYFPKVICLIGIEPFYKEYEEILMQIYKYFLYNKDNSKCALEKIVLNLIKSIPMPPFGIMEIKYKLNKHFSDIIIKRRQINKINNVDEYADYMFKIFNLDVCLDIFKYTLFEIKTIVFSKNINSLYKFIYGLINLLFPFKYPFQVSSCMPKDAYNFLESISPYIFGINDNYSEELLKKYIVSKNVNIIFIDLDNKKLIEKLNEKFPDLPKNLKKKIKSRIKKLWKGNNLNISKISEDEKDDKKEIDYEPNDKSISFIFYSSFFMNVMMDYSNYINKSDLKHKNKIFNIKNLFKINDFINSHNIMDKSFYKKFVETQMFSDFIYKKMIPENIDDKIEILFFDESIIRKKKKMKLSVVNKNTPFLKSDEFEYTQSFTIPQVEPLSKEEKERLYCSDIMFNNLLNGQYIETDKANDDDKEKNINEIKEDKNDTILKYFLFPKFDDEYFNEVKDEYFSFSSYKEDIHHIYSDILSKSENTSKEKSDIQTNINYAYLVYIELWAYSYWYHEEIERKYKFKQLLKIIDKISNHEIELYNLLFESLDKFKEQEKILQLYDKLFLHKLSPSSYIYSLINGIKNNKINTNNHSSGKFKKIKKLLSFKKNSSGKFDPNMGIIYKFRLRTIRASNELDIFGDKVYFETIRKCSECGKKINIYNLSLHNNNTIKNELWARCPYCKVYFLPLLTIYFGNFIFKKDSCKMTKCILYSPYELKKLIKNTFKDSKSQMLDVDNFKNRYPDLFWSSIWYFYLYKIDFSFFLPYENNINKFIKKTLIFSNIDSKIENKKEDNNINIIKKSKIKNKISAKLHNNSGLIIQSLISINFISNKKR